MTLKASNVQSQSTPFAYSSNFEVCSGYKIRSTQFPSQKYIYIYIFIFPTYRNYWVMSCIWHVCSRRFYSFHKKIYQIIFPHYIADCSDGYIRAYIAIKYLVWLWNSPRRNDVSVHPKSNEKQPSIYLCVVESVCVCVVKHMNTITVYMFWAPIKRNKENHSSKNVIPFQYTHTHTSSTSVLYYFWWRQCIYWKRLKSVWVIGVRGYLLSTIVMVS